MIFYQYRTENIEEVLGGDGVGGGRRLGIGIGLSHPKLSIVLMNNIIREELDYQGDNTKMRG